MTVDKTDDIDEIIRLIREGREVRLTWDGIEMTLGEHHIDDLLLVREMRQYMRAALSTPPDTEETT